ncbi:MAG: YkgJ family cysteine cluster protein [Deltaproteobacteria bacterium]|nr:YkgJ family cysteine cluster protein [Candidatus Anaeroferrophillacea bacterium]
MIKKCIYTINSVFVTPEDGHHNGPPLIATGQTRRRGNHIINLSAAHVCSGCGSCCRNFAFIRLFQDDIEAIASFTGLNADEFTGNIDKAGERRFMKFQENGDCIFLNNIHGAYRCSIYEARSAICRSYPATENQRKTCRANRGR